MRQAKEKQPVEPQAYTVAEFAEAYRISTGRLYELWKADKGPRFYRNGVKRMISVEAAREWQRAQERAANDE